ncbi:hypothetical protein AAVH_08952 [Aphelenchoides avenae]|nr:hypothetical protein AAVH_08952 [Aphelenchus avenae]
MVRVSLFGILLQGDKTLWMAVTELCSEPMLGVSVGTCLVSALGIIVVVLVVFIAIVSLTTWVLLKISDRVDRWLKRRAPATIRKGNSEARFIRHRRPPVQVNNGILPHPVTPMPRQNCQQPNGPTSAPRAREGESRSVDAMRAGKEFLEKRRRLKEKNSVDTIDPTALPGYFGDTDDLDKLLERVEGQPVRGTQTARPKKSTKKKGFRRRIVDNLPSEAEANVVRSEAAAAHDNEEVVNETTLKDMKYANSAEGSSARTRESSESSMSGRKKLLKTSDTSDIMHDRSVEISTNDSGASFSLSRKEDAFEDDFLLRSQDGTTIIKAQDDSVSPMAEGIPESVINNRLTQHKRRSSPKRPRPRDTTTRREDRTSQQFHFMSQMWSRFNEESDDYATYVAASSSH